MIFVFFSIFLIKMFNHMHVVYKICSNTIGNIYVICNAKIRNNNISKIQTKCIEIVKNSLNSLAQLSDNFYY